MLIESNAIHALLDTVFELTLILNWPLGFESKIGIDTSIFILCKFWREIQIRKVVLKASLFHIVILEYFNKKE